MKGLLSVEIANKLYVYSDEKSVLEDLCKEVHINPIGIYFVERKNRYALQVEHKHTQTQVKQLLYKYYDKEA